MIGPSLAIFIAFSATSQICLDIMGRQFWPFHGGNTSSNLVGDAIQVKSMA
jgi:hypothetical protein